MSSIFLNESASICLLMEMLLPHLPENYSTNTVVYTGTHDNNTTRGWYEVLPDAEQRRVWMYLKRADGDSNEIAEELLA